MMTGFRDKRGQAAAELAILGILLIVAFSFVMNFGQSLGRAQQAKMEAFRRTLKRAYNKNGTVSYTLKKNSNLASINSSFFQGQDSTAEGNASLTWSKGETGPMGKTDEGVYSYWQINNSPAIELGTVKQYRYGPTGSQSDEKVKVPVSIYKIDERRSGNYAYTLNKQESNAGISYGKEARVIDSSAGTLYTRINEEVDESPGDDDYPEPDYSREESYRFANDQVYTYAEGVPGNVQRWYVPHDL